MTPLVRSASLTHFVDVAAQCGLDSHALLVEAGLPPRCLDSPDQKVPAQAVGRLLELAARRGRENAFGLRMAESRRLSNLGPLGLLVRDEPTLRSALEALARHMHLHNEALAVRVEQLGSLVTIRIELWTEGGQALTQATELAVGVAFRVFSLFMGAGWRPRLVCFSHRTPASVTVHRRVFGRAVEFGHAFNGIVCDATELDAPNPSADPVMARYSRRILDLDEGPRAKLEARLRLLVVLLLPRGHCRVEVVAQHLGVDRRTLARHLAAEGTSFSEVVNAVRSDLVSRYLEDRARPLADISSLLGFSASSALARWHRQRFGVTARDSTRNRSPAR